MRDRLLQLISPLLLFLAWELLVRTGLLDVRFFPPPSEIAVRGWELLQDGTLAAETMLTVRRMAIGFLMAAVPALLIGVLMGVSRTARLLFAPLVAALYPVPKIALVPMVVILFGLGETSKYAIVFISVFFLVALNTTAGVMAVDRRYFDIAKNNGATGWDIVRTIAIPGAMPSILNGINLGLGFALTVIVGTELLLPQGGLGALIWRSYQIYDIATIFAVIVVVGLIGWLLNTLVLQLETQLIPWRAVEEKRLRRRDEPRIRRGFRIWWMATRPFSFTASITPVTLGAVYAAYEGAWNWWLFAITLIGSVAIQAGTNLINDYYDFRKGTDGPESLGPNRPLKEGLISERQVLVAGLLCFAFGSTLGLYLVATRGLFILWLGLFSVLAGWFYTAGPAAFAYIGLGEIVVFLFMGPVMVLGSYFVMTQQIALGPILLSLPVGLLVAAILHANNMRDLETDQVKGKRTLAHLLGRRASRWEYTIFVGGAFLLLLLLPLLGVGPWWLLLALLTLPAARRLLDRAWHEEAPQALNPLVRGSATLHERFGWLMIVGLLVGIVL